MNQNRREFVRLTGVFAVMASAGLISAKEAFAQQQAWNKAAFEAKSLDEAVKALGGPAATQSADISITAPDIAENGAVVPVAVTSKIPNTQNIYILVEKNPNSLQQDSRYRPEPKPTSRPASRWARPRTCMRSSKPTTSSTSPPRKSKSRSAVAAAEQQFSHTGANMADPMRIRATEQPDGVDVRVLMSHEMETGQRRDSAGKIVPAHYISNVTVSHNGKPVLSAEWGPAVAKNPYLQFKFKGGKKGDKLTVTWVDNKGDTRTDEATIS